MNTDLMFSSKTDIWSTPQSFFDKLDAEFHFTLDVCASMENAKCDRYFTETDDGLHKEWRGVCWMNPPYGREMPKWIRKAHEAALNGAIVVCLLPSRTDTKAWHEYVMAAHEVRFVRGRLKFGGCSSSAPFPSAVVVFRPAISVAA